MKIRLFFTLAALVALAVPATAAPPQPTPREELLRVAPTDFALVVVVQNLRDTLAAVSDSPFATWFPATPLGKQLTGSGDFKKITDAAMPIFGALGVTPTDVLHDIIGDAVVFAYRPARGDNPKGERSVILLHPRRPDTLAQLLDRLNRAQSRSKELKALTPHQHAGATYYERQKADGSSDFYCFRGGVFAFSGSESEIQAVIDRDAAPRDKPPELVARMTKLGVSDATAAVLVNPRPLDAEFAAKVKNAKPDDRAFLARFADVWAATDAAALYLSVDASAELGVSLQFNPAKLPAAARGWLAGDRTASAVWGAVPPGAMFAAAGRVKATDVLDFLAAVAPPDDNRGVWETVEQTLGPIVGRDKLPLVIDAIGPDWGLWVTPPADAKGAAVPVAVAAVKVRTDGPNGAVPAKSLMQALEFGVQTGRIAYNASHKDQIELREEKDGDAVFKSLSGEAFPAGFRPCFALKNGYLVVSNSPDAIRAFKVPAGEPKPGGDIPLARFSSAVARDYLSARAPELAKLLSAVGAGDEKTLARQLEALTVVLEPVDALELVARGNPTGVKLMLRVKPTKPTKPMKK